MIRTSRDGKTIIHSTKEIFEKLDRKLSNQEQEQEDHIESWNGIQIHNDNKSKNETCP